MSTGITLADDCAKTWEDMKVRHQYNFIIFKVENDKEIVVDKAAKSGTDYSEFVKALPEDDCRYAVLEIPTTSKIIFILWTPDEAKVKARMIYASTRSAILDSLKGTSKAIQCGTAADLELEKIKKAV